MSMSTSHGDCSVACSNASSPIRGRGAPVSTEPWRRGDPVTSEDRRLVSTLNSNSGQQSPSERSLPQPWSLLLHAELVSHRHPILSTPYNTSNSSNVQSGRKRHPLTNDKSNEKLWLAGLLQEALDITDEALDLLEKDGNTGSTFNSGWEGEKQ